MTITERIEKYLNFDRIDSHSVRVRARAVYVIGLVFLATQLVNLFGLYFTYGRIVVDHLLSFAVMTMVSVSIINLRYKLNFPFYALLFSFLIFAGTIASAVPDKTGINTALLVFFVLGGMVNGFISGVKAVGIFCGFGFVLIWYLYFVSRGYPAGGIFDPEVFALRNFQRAFQASLALIMVSVVCGIFSYNMQAAFDALEENLETARENDRAKTQFLANMSHELRTPMNGILGISEVLMETELNAEQTELTALINQSGETLVGLIADVLLFSQLESGKVQLSDDAFDLRPMILKAIAPHRVTAAQKKLPIYLSVPDNMPKKFYGDADRLQHVIASIMGNAVKFTNHGRIDIRALGTELEDGKCRLSLTIQDTGIGIADNKLAMIFERFRQVDESRTRAFGGTGLGLTVAQSLTRLMGGNITARSRVGSGSTFVITVDLPTQATINLAPITQIQNTLPDFPATGMLPAE